MKAVVATFNQVKALVGAFSVIMTLRMDLFEALLDTGLELEEVFIMAAGLVSTICPSYKHQDQYLQDTTRMYLDRTQSVLEKILQSSILTVQLPDC